MSVKGKSSGRQKCPTSICPQQTSAFVFNQSGSDLNMQIMSVLMKKSVSMLLLTVMFRKCVLDFIKKGALVGNNGNGTG